MTMTKKAVWALVGLLLVCAGVAIGLVISEPMTRFGRLFVVGNAVAALVALALLWLLIRGRD